MTPPDNIDPILALILAAVLWTIWAVIRLHEERRRLDTIERRIRRGQPFDEETKP